MLSQSTNIFVMISHLYTAPFTAKLKLLNQAGQQYGLHGVALQRDLERLFPTRDITNNTDWNYATCFSFSILLQPEASFPPISQQNWNAFIKEHKYLQLVQLEISALAPYYIVQYATGSYDPATTIYTYCTSCQPITEQHQALAHILYPYCEHSKLSLLPAELLSVRLPDVVLELAGAGEVTVYKFLFTDGYGEDILTDEVYCSHSRLEQ